ncbi:MAG: GspH/FimT family pseudopilin [Stenotrophobium sp.]
MQNERGFSLLELIIAMSIFAILVVMAIPAFGKWVANSRVRSVAETLQNGLNLSKAEAVRLNRSVQFSLTNGSPDATLTATAVANGTNWMIVAQALLAGDSATFVEGGQLGNLAPNVAISSTDSSGTAFATLAFTALGRVQSTAGITFPVTYAVSTTNSDRPLNVMVSAGSEVRLCDPNKSIANSPDGCK